MALENDTSTSSARANPPFAADAAVPSRFSPSQNYMHTALDAKPRSTPEYFRLFLSAIPMRYGPAAFVDWHKDKGELTAQEKQRYGRIGDTAVGVLSTYITTQYTRQTAHDIKVGFSELVGLELGKPAHQVTWKDFSRSKNILVKATMDVFKRRTFFRYLTDLPFFASHLPKLHGLPATYVGLFFKGLLLYSGVTGRHETFFETLVDIMDKRINPAKGLGDYVHTTDLVTLYQQYAELDKSHVRFIGLEDRKLWAKSEVMFSRMAELMNRTYQYSAAAGEPFSANPTADFPMPKFLYLLGFGMIDPKHVDRSLAYIEVANQYGIQEVKELKRTLDAGADLDQALKKYPLVKKPEEIKKSYAQHPSSPETQSPLVQRFAPAGNWSERTARTDDTPSTPSI